MLVLDHKNAKSVLEGASLWSILTFSFLNAMLKKGSQTPLQSEDIDPLPSSDRPENVHVLTQEESHNIIRSLLYKLFLKRWAISVVGHFVSLGMLTATPFVVRELVAYFGGKGTVWNGVVYAIVLVALNEGSSLTIINKFYQLYRIGNNLRSILMNAVYSKSLKLSSAAKQQSTTGETVNLLANDCQRIYDFVFFADFIWISAISIFVNLGLMVLYIGYAGLIAVALLFLASPLQAYSGKYIASVKTRMLKLTDERIKFMNEVLQGIRVIKLYAWEDSVSESISKLRKQELVYLKKINYLKVLNGSFMFLWPSIVVYAGVIVHIYSGNQFNVDMLFLLLTFMQASRFQISMIPQVINAIAEGAVAFKRISRFLKHEELESIYEAPPQDSDVAIQVSSASFSWNSSQTEPNLFDVNLKISKGKLVAVIGKVGAGKSSLLSAIMSEMNLCSGSVSLDGEIAYVSQSSWIQSKSIRENIIFNMPFDQLKYQKVLSACGLLDDLKMLPDGDQTEIGERGINLSGGQKARVSLARAAYCSDSKGIFLLDDPFSAVDMSVGKHIFDNCIQKLLSQKTRVVVMNSYLHYLPLFDQIIVLGNAEHMTNCNTIIASGNFADIERDFGSLVHHSGEDERFPDDYLEDKPLLKKASSERKDQSGDSVLLSSSKMNAGKQLFIKEDRQIGKVEAGAYLQYFNSASDNHGKRWMFFTLFIYGIAQILKNCGDFWLLFWAQDSVKKSHSLGYWIWTNALWIILLAVALVFRSIVFVNLATNASQNLHDSIFRALLSASIPNFFDVTPIGQILNRFSKDLDNVDVMLPDFLSQTLFNTFVIISALIVTIIGSPYVLLIILPTLYVFVWIRGFFSKSSREIKRIEAISRSPIFSMFAETLNGLSTIRAFNQTEIFSKMNKSIIGRNARAFLTTNLVDRWLSVRLDFMSTVIVAAIALLGVGLRGSIDSGLISLAVLNAMLLTGVLQWSVRCTVEVENNMTSVERLLQFSKIPSEGIYRLKSAETLTNWPERGLISFRNVKLRFRPELELVLKGISFDILPKEKIGICGRTGSGKSTTILALFRVVTLDEGSILIDDVDISSIGVGDLREKICIIPQDPVLLSGTLRFNLDPFRKYSDERIYEVLEKVHLLDYVSSLPEKLEERVAEFGENFSHGQRQLICIARALLRKTRIVVLDEATASVDQETDRMIQSTIRELFRDCTVLTIAHRLNTIIDSDRIIVLGDGKLLEMDTPTNLLSNSSGVFFKLWKEAQSENH